MEKTIKHIKKILIAVDFTEKSDNAIQLGIRMAQRHKAKIILFHNYNNFYIIDRTGRQVIGKETISSNYEQAEKSLTEVKLMYQQQYPDIPFQSFIGNETIVNSINHQISSASVDLVIIGTSGNQGLRELVLGSVSYQLLNNVHCPILLIPADSNIYHFRKILVPVRVLEELNEKIELAECIAEKNNGIIKVLGISHVKDESKMKEAFVSVNHLLSSNNIDFKSSFSVTDDKATEISEISKEDSFDLIVLNNQDEQSWKSIFSENFLKQIINNTSIPLLFYRNIYKEAEINQENTGYDITLPCPG
ncbi:universal stress protein [Chryseobacterium sp. RLHN22]|uniref:universal stress protein n=1 Tax=Chryseobacterium sp. RLHN22 TaxID=3437885 RepID=UPI003D9B8AEF